MILIDKKQVNIKELAAKLGIELPLDKILKRPLFEINPALVIKDPANGAGAVKVRQGMEFPCVFRARVNGEDVEIRYCTNRTPDVKTNGQTEKYAPRSVNFEGKAEYIGDDQDKAVFYYLHFYCKQSPFFNPAVPFEYEFVDDAAKADAKIAQMQLKQEAMTHASQLSGDNMLIIAKGMKIAGVSGMEPAMVKAELMQYALDRPAEYLNKAQSQVNHIEGLIRDAVDRRIFIIESAYNSRRWKWGMGVKNGELLIEISTSVPDEVEALLTHINQNINEILPVLINTSKALYATNSVKEAVKEINVLDMLKPDVTNDQNTPPPPPADNQIMVLPTNFKEATEFLNQQIGKKTPALASRLVKGVETGEITIENIALILEEMKTA